MHYEVFDDTVVVVVVVAENLVNGDDVVVDVANHESMDFAAETPPSPVAVVVAAEIVVDC